MGGTLHGGLGPPTLNSNQENAPQTRSQAKLTETTPPPRLPLPSYI